MSTPPGTYDTLDALDQATQAATPLAGPSSPPADQSTDNSIQPAPPLAAPGSAPFISQTQPPQITWGTQGEPAVSMAGLWITPDDSLVLTVWNSNPLLNTVTVQYRVLKPDGTLVVESFALNNLTANRVANSISVAQLEGMLVGVVVGPPTVALSRGQTFVNVSVFRGTTQNPVWTETLVADYLTSGFYPAWPYGRVQSATEERGYIYTAVSPVPVVGVPPVLALPAGARWRLMSVSFTYNAIGGAASRQVILQIAMNGGDVYQCAASSVQAPGTNATYTFAAGFPLVNAIAGNLLGPLPNELILAGNTAIELTVLNLQAGDNFSVMVAAVEEWLDV